MKTRVEALRSKFEPAWPQSRMALFLGVDQSAVSRLENGQAEPGPVSRLLDLLEAAIARETVTPGMSPDECLHALGVTAADATFPFTTA